MTASDAASVSELMAVLLARDLRPEDRSIQIGANMPVARAGALLACMTRLPDTRVIAGPSIDNLAGGRAAPPVFPFLFDARALEFGEARMVQATVFDDMSRPDVFFIGGLQVDRRGNVNLLGIPGENGRWALRGPGAVALPTMSTYCRGYYIVMMRHDTRTFVEEVACVTALGDRRTRGAYGFPGGGPRLILSPLGVFDLDPSGDLRVVSVHRGVTLDQVVASTGFDLVVDEVPPTTPTPDAEELRVLRTRIDRAGLLRDT